LTFFRDPFDSESEIDDSSSSFDTSPPTPSTSSDSQSKTEQWTREEVLALFRVVLIYMASYAVAKVHESETSGRGGFRFRQPIPKIKHPIFPDHPIRPLPHLFNDYWQASIQSSVQTMGGKVFIMPPIMPTRGAAPPSIVSTRPPAWAIPHVLPLPPPPPPYNPHAGQEYLNRIRNGEVRRRGRILTIPPRTPPVQKPSILMSLLETVTESVSVLGKRRQRDDEDEEGGSSKKGKFGLWWF
jgi:hypothetical protein